MTDLDNAAKRLADRLKHADLTDPILRHLEASEFLRNRGFDISTIAGCKGALLWLEGARVEDAFWEENGPVDNPTDWYLGEARLDAMKTIVKGRIRELEKPPEVR